MHPKDYIFKIRKITITQAAAELGYSRQHISSVCNGLPAGRRLSEKFSAWSNNLVSFMELIRPSQKS